MRKTILKWTVLVALLAYSAFMVVWAGSMASTRICQGIEVHVLQSEGVDSVTRKGVVDELIKYDNHLVGKSIKKINTQKIENYLAHFSNFESVQCFITSADMLRIDVVRIIPELRVFEGDQSYYINKDGKRINANAEFFSNVPVVSGHFSKKFPASALLPVTHYITADSLLKNLITMVKADDPNNIILIPRIAGHVVNIGNTSNLKAKFRNLLTMYSKVIPYKGWETYDTISVKFNGQIVATRRDKSNLINYEMPVEEEDPEEATLSGLETTETAQSTGTETKTNH